MKFTAYDWWLLALTAVIALGFYVPLELNLDWSAPEGGYKLWHFAVLALVIPLMQWPLFPLLSLALFHSDKYLLWRWLAVTLGLAFGGLCLLALFPMAIMSGPGALFILTLGAAVIFHFMATIIGLSGCRMNDKTRGFILACLSITAAAALWSFLTMPIVAVQAARTADGSPYCLVDHVEGAGEAHSSVLHLRGMNLFTTATGYKMSSRWYYHSIMLVQDGDTLRAFNWSHRRLRYDEIRNYHQKIIPIGEQCEPVPNFIRRIVIGF